MNLLQNLRIKRQAATDKDGSPAYVWIPAALAAAAYEEIEIARQFHTAAKYQPLDWLEIENLETTNAVTLSINGGVEVWRAAPGAVRHIRNKALWSLRVTNVGAAITTVGNVRITIMREAVGVDEAVRRSVVYA